MNKDYPPGSVIRYKGTSLNPSVHVDWRYGVVIPDDGKLDEIEGWKRGLWAYFDNSLNEALNAFAQGKSKPGYLKPTRRIELIGNIEDYFGLQCAECDRRMQIDDYLCPRCRDEGVFP